MAKDSLRQDGWGGGNALQRDFGFCLLKQKENSAAQIARWTLYCAAEFSTSNCYHVTFHVMIADKITYLSVFLFLDAASAAAAPARPRAARSRSVLSPVLGALLLFTAATLAIAAFLASSAFFSASTKLS